MPHRPGHIPAVLSLRQHHAIRMRLLLKRDYSNTHVCGVESSLYIHIVLVLLRQQQQIFRRRNWTAFLHVAHSHPQPLTAVTAADSCTKLFAATNSHSQVFTATHSCSQPLTAIHNRSQLQGNRSTGRSIHLIPFLLLVAVQRTPRASPLVYRLESWRRLLWLPT